MKYFISVICLVTILSAGTVLSGGANLSDESTNSDRQTVDRDETGYDHYKVSDNSNDNTDAARSISSAVKVN